MSISDSSSDLKKLTDYEDEEENRRYFEPVPYVFKIPDKWKKAGASSIISPPNWLLLDHTIAVIWSLFNTFSPNKALDIEDLKWAYEFLKDIRNSKGDHPPDVNTCLMEIQDRLIDLYAQLSHSKEDKAVERTVQGTVSLWRQKTNSIEEPKVKKKEIKPRKADNKESLKDIPKSESIVLRKHVKDAALRESKKSLVQQRRMSTTPSSNDPVPSRRSEKLKKESGKKEDAPVENFFMEMFQRNRTNDRVLGAHTLPNHGRKKNPSLQREQLNEDVSNEMGEELTQNEGEDKKISLEFKRWVTQEELNNEEQAYKKLKDEIRNLMKNPKISKEEVLKFLSNWREEQVERLQSELKRLNSIEEFMKSVKMEGFVPYVQDDLAKKLEFVTCKKNNNRSS